MIGGRVPRRPLASMAVLTVFAIAVLGLLSGCTEEGRQQIKDRISGAVTPTEAPTEAPTEEPTEAPTEEPTAAPTSEAPTQEPTEEPSSQPSEETASKQKKAAATTDDGGIPWWVWVVAIVVLVGVIAAVVVRSRRTASSLEAWRGRARDTYSVGLALHDRLASELVVPPSQPPPTPAPSPTWAETEQMIDRVAADLHWLRTDPPGESEGRQVEELQAALDDLRSGVSLWRQVPGTDAAAVASATTTLRGRLADFEASLRRFAAAVRGAEAQSGS